MDVLQDLRELNAALRIIAEGMIDMNNELEKELHGQ